MHGFTTMHHTHTNTHHMYTNTSAYSVETHIASKYLQAHTASRDRHQYMKLCFFSFNSLGANEALFTGVVEKNDTEQQEEVSFVQ